MTARGKVAVLTLNHPETVNAASFAMMQGCLRAMDAIEADTGLRAMVLTGEGRGFCSGANLTEPPPQGADAGEMLERTYHPFLRRLRDSRLPIVTALNGPAAGVGMSLALMGDLVVAARSAFFALGFTRLGLVPDGGATWLLPRLVGLGRARELALLGERLPAEKAYAWGLIHKVVDDEAMMDEALRAGEPAVARAQGAGIDPQAVLGKQPSQFRGAVEARAGRPERGRRHRRFPRRPGGVLRETRSALSGRIAAAPSLAASRPIAVCEPRRAFSFAPQVI